MDTIYLGFDGLRARNQILHAFEVSGLPINYKGKNGKRKDRVRGYTNTTAVSYNGHKTHLAYEPHYANLPQASLTVQLSHFKSFHDCCVWAQQLMGEEYLEFIRASVTRLDMCVDLGVPIDTIVKNVSRGKCQRMYELIGADKSITLYLGSDEEVKIYRKHIPIDAVDFWGDGKLDVDPHGMVYATRIEKSLRGKSCPLSNLWEIDGLRGTFPFKDIKINHVDEEVLETLPPKKKHVVQSYLYRKEKYNAEVARREFSANGNFKRDIGDYLKELNIDLKAAWDWRVERYLGPSPVKFGLKDEITAEVEHESEPWYQ